MRALNVRICLTYAWVPCVKKFQFNWTNFGICYVWILSIVIDCVRFLKIPRVDSNAVQIYCNFQGDQETFFYLNNMHIPIDDTMLFEWHEKYKIITVSNGFDFWCKLYFKWWYQLARMASVDDSFLYKSFELFFGKK